MNMAFALLMSGLCAGGAVALAILSCFKWKYLVQEKRCTAKTTGTVTCYSWWLMNDSYALPRVEYSVDGKRYSARGPEYAWYVSKTRTAPWLKNRMRVPTDPDAQASQVLHMDFDVNSFVGVKAPATAMYPIGTQLDVFYDPHKPKLAYVKRYCNLKWAFWLLAICAAVLAVVGALLFGFLWNDMHYVAADGTPVLVEAGNNGTNLTKTGDSTFDIVSYGDWAGSGRIETADEYRSDLAAAQAAGEPVEMPPGFALSGGVVYRTGDDAYVWFGEVGGAHVSMTLAGSHALYYDLRNISIGGVSIGAGR